MPLWHATQRTAASAFLCPACSRYPCRHGASEDYSDGHWDDCPCMWPPKQPLDIMSCHMPCFLSPIEPQTPLAGTELTKLLILVALRKLDDCQSWPTSCGLFDRSEAAGLFNVLMPNVSFWRYLMLHWIFIYKIPVAICGNHNNKHDTAIVIHNIESQYKPDSKCLWLFMLHHHKERPSVFITEVPNTDWIKSSLEIFRWPVYCGSLTIFPISLHFSAYL